MTYWNVPMMTAAAMARDYAVNPRCLLLSQFEYTSRCEIRAFPR